MEAVAVGTTRYQFRVTQAFHLSMIAFVIGLRGDGKNAVSLHHRLVAVAFLADFGMKFLSELHHLRFITL